MCACTTAAGRLAIQLRTFCRSENPAACNERTRTCRTTTACRDKNSSPGHQHIHRRQKGFAGTAHELLIVRGRLFCVETSWCWACPPFGRPHLDVPPALCWHHGSHGRCRAGRSSRGERNGGHGLGMLRCAAAGVDALLTSRTGRPDGHGAHGRRAPSPLRWCEAACHSWWQGQAHRAQGAPRHRHAPM